MNNKIMVEFGTQNAVQLGLGEDVTVAQLILASRALMARADQLTFINEASVMLEQVMPEESENEEVYECIMRLGVNVKKNIPNIEGTDFVGRLLILMYEHIESEDVLEAKEFINKLDWTDFVAQDSSKESIN